MHDHTPSCFAEGGTRCRHTGHFVAPGRFAADPAPETRTPWSKVNPFRVGDRVRALDDLSDNLGPGPRKGEVLTVAKVIDATRHPRYGWAPPVVGFTAFTRPSINGPYDSPKLFLAYNFELISREPQREVLTSRVLVTQPGKPPVTVLGVAMVQITEDQTLILHQPDNANFTNRRVEIDRRDWDEWEVLP